MAISTNGIVQLTSTWTQRETDSINANNIVTDAGQLAYSYAYSSGTGSGTVNEVFHALARLGSGSGTGFNLQSAVQNYLGYSVSKTFTDVNSITIKNHSTISGYNFTVNVNSASGFREPFGYPTGSINIKAGDCLHRNTLITPFIVGTGSRYIGITDAGSGATFELIVLGHR